MRKSFLLILLTLLVACGVSPQKNSENMKLKHDSYQVINTVRLTVAESKRLIAKGLYQNSEVQAKLKKGMIIITRGSTNTYIAEEFTGLDAPRGSLVTGKVIPATVQDFAQGLELVPEVVIVDGRVVDMSFDEALSRMSEGDIIFKGANLINYDLGQAGVNVGAPNGGTVAKIRPYLGEGKGRWITPVGLEKDCSAELFSYSEMLAKAEDRRATTLLDVTDQSLIYTEIEAIKEFANVDVYPVAKGGLSGAEGGTSLMICGDEDQVARALEAVATVLGEAEFVPRD